MLNNWHIAHTSIHVVDFGGANFWFAHVHLGNFLLKNSSFKSAKAAEHDGTIFIDHTKSRKFPCRPNFDTTFLKICKSLSGIYLRDLSTSHSMTGWLNYACRRVCRFRDIFPLNILDPIYTYHAKENLHIVNIIERTRPLLLAHRQYNELQRCLWPSAINEVLGTDL